VTELNRQLLHRFARLLHATENSIVRREMLLLHSAFQAVEELEFVLHLVEKTSADPAAYSWFFSIAIHFRPSR
jgi:hypothetical protein